jgi:hypothetical protein
VVYGAALFNIAQPYERSRRLAVKRAEPAHEQESSDDRAGIETASRSAGAIFWSLPWPFGMR